VTNFTQTTSVCNSVYPTRIPPAHLLTSDWSVFTLPSIEKREDNHERYEEEENRKQLDEEWETWRRFSGAVELILRDA
jgi:hypothetical protein